MKFEQSDLKDPRVLSALPGWQAYPRETDTAPLRPGVFILADKNDGVVHIGASSKGNLREQMLHLIGDSSDRNAVKFRWVVTREDLTASELAVEWRRKYENGMAS
jgi:hypothetical protein